MKISRENLEQNLKRTLTVCKINKVHGKNTKTMNFHIEEKKRTKKLIQSRGIQKSGNKLNKDSTNKDNVGKNKSQNATKILEESNAINTSLAVTQQKMQRETTIKQKKERKDQSDINLKELTREHILQCLTAIFHLTEVQLKNKSLLFSAEKIPIFMQVTCIRVPKVPKRQMRILLPHSIVSPEDDIALFVCDLERGRRKDYEPTVEHYRGLLDKHGCMKVKDIIAMNQVKTEFDQFELKRKLVSSYDFFLVDGRIAGHISHLLGNEFYKKRKLPIAVRMQSKDLRHEIDYALKKTNMQLHSFGDTHIVQIGHTSMEKGEILENIVETCNYLNKNYPGGWENIRCLRIKTPSSLGVPLFITLKNKNSIKIPIVKAKRPKAYRNVEDELTTLRINNKVIVTPEGNVVVKRMKKEKEKAEDNQEV